MLEANHATASPALHHFSEQSEHYPKAAGLQLRFLAVLLNSSWAELYTGSLTN
jgi:hypothetical protein